MITHRHDPWDVVAIPLFWGLLLALEVRDWVRERTLDSIWLHRTSKERWNWN